MAAIEEASERIGCPIEALDFAPHVTPADVLHLSTAERKRFRTVSKVHIPCEQFIGKVKVGLASSHAAETASFANGAYVKDPLRFVRLLTAGSSFLAVGGDTGDKITKIGVTYVDSQGKQQFAALMVYRGKDNHADFTALKSRHITFIGESDGCAHIFDVLQHFINHFINHFVSYGIQAKLPFAPPEQSAQ
jgi:hypothetical protein